MYKKEQGTINNDEDLANVKRKGMSSIISAEKQKLYTEARDRVNTEMLKNKFCFKFFFGNTRIADTRTPDILIIRKNTERKDRYMVRALVGVASF